MIISVVVVLVLCAVLSWEGGGVIRKCEHGLRPTRAHKCRRCDDTLADLERADIRWRLENDPEWSAVFGGDYRKDGTPKTGSECDDDDSLFLPGGFIVPKKRHKSYGSPPPK